MFNRYRLIVALLVVALLGGGIGQTVSAAAAMDSPIENNRSYEEIEYSYNNSWQDFIRYFFLNQNKNEHIQNKETWQVRPEKENEWTGNQQQNNAINKAPVQNENQTTSSSLNEFEQEVINLTNAERVKYGLKAFQIDEDLSKVAREKSRDIQVNNYFDHNSPVYGSPFDMMKSFGISYQTAGENIAKGQQTPTEVVNAWMNSEGHRANILNGSFTHIGVGYYQDGNVWTQQFIGK